MPDPAVADAVARLEAARGGDPAQPPLSPVEEEETPAPLLSAEMARLADYTAEAEEWHRLDEKLARARAERKRVAAAIDDQIAELLENRRAAAERAIPLAQAGVGDPARIIAREKGLTWTKRGKAEQSGGDEEE